jgi:hypothetical protein
VRGRIAVALGVVGGALAGITGTWLVTRGGDESAAPPATAPAPVSTTKPGTAGELEGLLNAGRRLTFHVKYTTLKGGATADLELWSAPPRARRDVDAVTTQGRARTAEIRLEDKVVRCVQTARTPWQCAPEPVGQLADPGDLTLGAVNVLDGSTITARDDRVLDTPVRCFAVQPPADTTGRPSEICLTGEGIPLRVDGGDGPSVATLFERKVDGKAFDPPAKLIGGGGP